MNLARTFYNALKATTKRSFASSLTKTKEHSLDPIQEASLSERCFLVDENDKIIGNATKKECHSVNKTGDILLHRAFSVFLFNKKGDLLLQKRSSSKVSSLFLFYYQILHFISILFYNKIIFLC